MITKVHSWHVKTNMLGLNSGDEKTIVTKEGRKYSEIFHLIWRMHFDPECFTLLDYGFQWDSNVVFKWCILSSKTTKWKNCGWEMSVNSRCTLFYARINCLYCMYRSCLFSFLDYFSTASGLEFWANVLFEGFRIGSGDTHKSIQIIWEAVLGEISLGNLSGPMPD